MVYVHDPLCRSIFSTGTEAEFDNVKLALEKVVAEKTEYEINLKQLNDEEAARLRVRQEQADSVASATLEILNRNAADILPPDIVDDDNLATFDVSTPTRSRPDPPNSRVSAPPSPSPTSTNDSSVAAATTTPQYQPLSASNSKPSSTSVSPSPSFQNKRKKPSGLSTQEILEDLLEDDSVAEIVSAKNETIAVCERTVQSQSESHETHRQDLLLFAGRQADTMTQAHGIHRQDLLDALAANKDTEKRLFDSNKDMQVTQLRMADMFQAFLDRLPKM